ncbi:tyrosine-type recombinase/integrase [Peribacillus sp. YIM B13477]|uniref:tyrosine-type recombinase/integrase n=1 Tax=Peribacillus sp. YIM B13477 TaxID=3366300 RepID=UPI00366E46CB
MSISQAWTIIKLVAKRTDIKKSIHPHQLRHSYATNLLNNGAPIEVNRNLMGHERETTKIYAHIQVVQCGETCIESIYKGPRVLFYFVLNKLSGQDSSSSILYSNYAINTEP